MLCQETKRPKFSAFQNEVIHTSIEYLERIGKGWIKSKEAFAIQFDENYLYWGTDDIMDGKAKFVRAIRGDPLKVQVMGNVGNLVRTLTNTPYGLLFYLASKT